MIDIFFQKKVWSGVGSEARPHEQNGTEGFFLGKKNFSQNNYPAEWPNFFVGCSDFFDLVLFPQYMTPFHTRFQRNLRAPKCELFCKYCGLLYFEHWFVYNFAKPFLAYRLYDDQIYIEVVLEYFFCRNQNYDYKNL